LFVPVFTGCENINFVLHVYIVLLVGFTLYFDSSELMIAHT